MNAFLEQIQKILSPDAILNSKDDCKAYGTDWTRVAGEASIVLFPKTTKEVSEILKICYATKTKVIPSGGRTGLAGGITAKNHEVALNLSKMTRIDSVDLVGRTVRVQAGAVTEAVHDHCELYGLTWPIDLAAKGTSTIGGNLATNAGGVRVIRYGMARKWVSALQAVTMSGEIIELNQGLEKNNTGYDLIQLLVGSEGTLAVITEATLKLVRVPKNVMVLFFSFKTIEKMDAFFLKARSAPFEIQALEFFSDKCLSAVESQLGRKSKLQSPGKYYMLLEIEAEDHTSARESVDNWLAEVLSDETVLDGMLAQTSEERKTVWMLREGITESLQKMGMVKKFDVAVPVARMKDFLKDVEKLFEEKKYNLSLYLFGHYGDGSPHLNLLKPDGVSDSDFLREYERVEKDLFPVFKSYHGSISAEHGVGHLKKNWVIYSRSREELRLFKAIKTCFDPWNLLNPGKIIDL